MRKLFKIAIAISFGILPLIAAPAIAPPYRDTQDTICLAKNIYHEARGESLHGRKAVAQVTINRLQSGLFASTICQVVYQPNQFSWTNQRHKLIHDLAAWNESLLLARTALRFGVDGFENFKALYYHNTTVNPRWRLRYYKRIENHIFYI